MGGATSIGGCVGIGHWRRVMGIGIGSLTGWWAMAACVLGDFCFLLIRFWTTGERDRQGRSMFVCFCMMDGYCELVSIKRCWLALLFCPHAAARWTRRIKPRCVFDDLGASHDFFLDFSVCAFLSFGALVLVLLLSA
ncbi:hypothetical protein V8C44DRAFT_12450 [Trichoderma aethiopicum]